MCRDIDHGGRRCPSDNSTARRARRYAAKAAQAGGTSGASSVRPVPKPAPVVEKTDAEKIRDRATTLRTGLDDVDAANQSLLEFSRQLARENRYDHDVFAAKLREERERLAEQLPGGIIQTDSDSHTVTVDWGVVEREITEIGAQTDAWLDEQLTDQVAARNAAVAAKAAAEDELKKMKPLNDEKAAELKSGSSDEAVESQERYRQWLQETITPIEERMQDARAQIRAAEDAYFARKRELLGELRPMGGTLEWTTAGVSTPKRVDAHIQKAASMLPADWIDRSARAVEDGRAKPLRVRESTTRAHYCASKEITRRETTEKIVWSPPSIIAEYENNPTPYREVIYEDQMTQEQLEQRRDYYADHLPTRSYDVAWPGQMDWGTGRTVVNEDGTLNVTGRAAAGWERHEYTDSDGEERLCWRRPKKEVNTWRESGNAELTIPKGAEESSTALHELTHRCEDVHPRLGFLEAEFLRRRTTGEDGRRQPLEPYYKGARGEAVRPDSFIDRYIGKDYGTTRYHEVLSVGHEVALYGRSGGFGKIDESGRKDDDHHAFVLGTLLAG